MKCNSIEKQRNVIRNFNAKIFAKLKFVGNHHLLYHIKMYRFNHEEIIRHHLHQIEYSIIDSCNKNCKSCSHFAPLVKESNRISIEEFIKNTQILHNVIPDVHTFWLIGGEPTLHPQYLEILKELRKIYNNIPIGVMSNGYGVIQKKDDENFWKFIRENEIVWRITTYGVLPRFYRELYAEQGV